VTPLAELRRRLALDRRAIARSLGDGRSPGRVVEVVSGLSDPHNGGRTVAIVRFASGLRVVYKPRAVGLEAAFHRVVAWWNEQAGHLALFAPRVIDRGRYGWMEFVAYEGCANHEAASRYWERAGALIALADLLDATDMHHGNVIAHGEYPVLVDLETLLQPRWPGEERSILDTGLVPAWIRGPDGGSYDVSGFGAIARQQYRGDPVPLRENVVRVGTDIVSVAEFADRVEAGFLFAGKLLCERLPELLATTGPLHGFRGLEVRVMLRHTETYRAAGKDGRAPGPESLLRPVRAPYALKAIAKTERAALRRGDIPRFVASTDRCEWTARPTSSFKALMARARRLEPARFEEQARLLRTALALWSLGGALSPVVQQQHEDEVKDRGPRKQKQHEAAHARRVFL
jgi:class II lanthipeptide synthase